MHFSNMRVAQALLAIAVLATRYDGWVVQEQP